MRERLNCSISTGEQRPLHHGTTEAGHLIFIVLEEPTECKCGTQTLDGGNSSNIKMASSLMSEMERSLMFKVVEILKVKLSNYGRRMALMLKNGQLSTKTRRKNSEEKERMKNSTLKLADPSTLDQECQCRELLNAGVPTMLSSLIMYQEEEVNNSSLMRLQRLLNHNNGKIDL